ncbi:MAG: ubiquinol-cytochrome c reductase iron-sulfur subunit [Gemmatimonadota bacterium]|jgi:Rieske Fe-S protein|nr:MAG: ubiquinol-cytochrome c reductase iron-sulfur subunit [Gemmatimonadota bacterium]
MVDRFDSTRRRFLRWLMGTSAGAFLVAVFYPVTRYIIPPAAAESAASSVTLPFSPADIAPNTAEIFKFGNKAGILVRTPTGELRAFSALCTHLNCIVQYREDLGQIWCACHNGHFDLNGRNVSGPPPAPLEAFTVNVREDEIVVSRD